MLLRRRRASLATPVALGCSRTLKKEITLAPDPRWLDALPRKKGFRLRGTATTRIETFTDAAFAFALTLLVLSAEVPTSYAGLVDTLKGIPAFALSAAVLMMFWAGHHTFSRRFGLEDATTLVLSFVLVFTVLVYVYPLRFLFASMIGWLGYVTGLGGPPVGIDIEPTEVNRLFVVYGAGFVAMCGLIVLLNLHAWRLRDELGLDAVERFDTRTEIEAWSLVGGAGVLSVLLALVLPPTVVGIPGWAYMVLAIVMPWFSVRADRKRRSIEDGRTDS